MVDGNNIGFFFGAGASIEFGIPTMRAMTMDFYNLINSNNTILTKLFNNVYNSMEEIYGKDKIDIESIMSVLRAYPKSSLQFLSIWYNRFIRQS